MSIQVYTNNVHFSLSLSLSLSLSPCLSHSLSVSLSLSISLSLSLSLFLSLSSLLRPFLNLYLFPSLYRISLSRLFLCLIPTQLFLHILCMFLFPSQSLAVSSLLYHHVSSFVASHSAPFLTFSSLSPFVHLTVSPLPSLSPSLSFFTSTPLSSFALYLCTSRGAFSLSSFSPSLSILLYML